MQPGAARPCARALRPNAEAFLPCSQVLRGLVRDCRASAQMLPRLCLSVRILRLISASGLASRPPGTRSRPMVPSSVRGQPHVQWCSRARLVGSDLQWRPSNSTIWSADRQRQAEVMIPPNIDAVVLVMICANTRSLLCDRPRPRFALQTVRFAELECRPSNSMIRVRYRVEI